MKRRVLTVRDILRSCNGNMNAPVMLSFTSKQHYMFKYLVEDAKIEKVDIGQSWVGPLGEEVFCIRIGELVEDRGDYYVHVGPGELTQGTAGKAKQAAKERQDLGLKALEEFKAAQRLRDKDPMERERSHSEFLRRWRSREF